MKCVNWLQLLQLFADGGAGGAAAGGAGAGAAAGEAASAAAADAGQQTGVTPSDAGTEPAGGQEETFDSLVEGKYKADFDSKVRQIVKARLQKAEAEKKAMTESSQKWERAHRLLAVRYGLDAENLDPEQLSEQMMRDDSYLQELADRNGTTVEFQRAQLSLQWQQEQLQKMQAQQEQEAADREYFSSLVQQEAVLKQQYPDFSIQKELQDERFRKLTRQGTSVEDAYWMLHRSELTQRMVQDAITKAQAAASAAVASGSMRPSEAGAGKSGPAEIKNTQKWTEERMKAIRKAVERGERVGPGHPLWG